MTERITTGNMRLASCGVKCLNSSSVFQINFRAGLTVWCSEIPHERQAQKRCGEIRSATFATTFARITSASCAAASRTSHNKRICKILKSRTSSDLELHKSARTLADIVEKPSRNKENLQNSKLEKYL